MSFKKLRKMLESMDNTMEFDNKKIYDVEDTTFEKGKKEVDFRNNNKDHKFEDLKTMLTNDGYEKPLAEEDSDLDEDDMEDSDLDEEEEFEEENSDSDLEEDGYSYEESDLDEENFDLEEVDLDFDEEDEPKEKNKKDIQWNDDDVDIDKIKNHHKIADEEGDDDGYLDNDEESSEEEKVKKEKYHDGEDSSREDKEDKLKEEVLNPEIQEIVKKLDSISSDLNVATSSLKGSLNAITVKGIKASLNELCSKLREAISDIDSKKLHESFFDSDESAIDSIFNMNSEKATNTNLVYDFNKPDMSLDKFQVFLKDNLKKYGVKSVNVETEEDNSIVNFDLEFGGKNTLTFAMYVDPAGLPRIGCKFGENKGKDSYLPTNFVDNWKITLNTSVVSFPFDFIVSCIDQFIKSDSLSESDLRLVEQAYIVPENVNAKYRFALVEGREKWITLTESTPRRNRLTIPQENAIRKKFF